MKRIQWKCSKNSWDSELLIGILLDFSQCSYQFPVDECVKNSFLLDSTQCGFQFPVDVCAKNRFLLDAKQCGFEFPVAECVKNDILLDANQCNFEFPKKVCEASPELFTRTQCQSHVSGPVCASTPAITNEDFCLKQLKGYQPTLFECSDNKANLCKLKLCDKHQFIVKCWNKVGIHSNIILQWHCTAHWSLHMYLVPTSYCPQKL